MQGDVTIYWHSGFLGIWISRAQLVTELFSTVSAIFLIWRSLLVEMPSMAQM